MGNKVSSIYCKILKGKCNGALTPTNVLVLQIEKRDEENQYIILLATDIPQ